MSTHHIQQLIGTNAVTLDDGNKLYDKIYLELKKGESVTLDFSGVRITASSFLNASIAQLLRDISPETLNELIVFQNLPNHTYPLLRAVIANAKRYYGIETKSTE